MTVLVVKLDSLTLQTDDSSSSADSLCIFDNALPIFFVVTMVLQYTLPKTTHQWTLEKLLARFSCHYVQQQILNLQGNLNKPTHVVM